MPINTPINTPIPTGTQSLPYLRQQDEVEWIDYKLKIGRLSIGIESQWVPSTTKIFSINLLSFGFGRGRYGFLGQKGNDFLDITANLLNFFLMIQIRLGKEE